LELASFIYESRKISFPDREEPHPAVVIASPIKYLPAAAPSKVKLHEEEVTLHVLTCVCPAYLRRAVFLI
jgi:hypothetical protein